MSLLDTASLICTPNGYKEGKLYSIIPTDGSGDLSVTRATTATRVNSQGLVESMGNNIPRLDYSNGTCPSILVEPQRTNLVLNSEDFSAASWINFQTSETVNNTTAPNGLNTADRMTQTGAGSGSIYTATVTLSGASTASCYFKAGTSDFVAIDSNGTGGYWGAAFNLTTLAITYFGSGTNGKIEDVGNGWFRCSVSVNATGVNYLAFGIIGNISDYVYLWGAQLEAGSYATSYIPTTSASVTRNADVISKTGISSLIGQTEGTLFIETQFTNVDSFSSYIGLTSGAFTNSIIIGKEAGVTPNKLILYIAANGSAILNNTTTALSSDYVKCAIAYKSGDWAAYINGTLVASGTSTFSFSSSLDIFGIGANNGSLSQTFDKTQTKAAAIWKTRLTNTQLAQLTTI